MADAAKDRRFGGGAGRIAAALAVAVSVGVSAGPSSAQKNETTMAAGGQGSWSALDVQLSNKVAASLFKSIDLLRTKKGLPALTPDRALGQIASDSANRQFDEDDPTARLGGGRRILSDGRTLRDHLLEADGQIMGAAELDVISTRGSDWSYSTIVRGVASEWLKGTNGDREVLLDPAFDRAGVGVVIRGDRMIVVLILAHH